MQFIHYTITLIGWKILNLRSEMFRSSKIELV